MRKIKLKVSKVLATNIKRLRESRGLTLEELGSRVGVSKQAIWALENERSWITIDKVSKLALYFQIEEHELFTADLKKQS